VDGTGGGPARRSKAPQCERSLDMCGVRAHGLAGARTLRDGGARCRSFCFHLAAFDHQFLEIPLHKCYKL
jgi:hypothetical protein